MTDDELERVQKQFENLRAEAERRHAAHMEKRHNG
jgi:hypothetical protein